MSRLVVEADQHRYSLDNHRVPSVTTIVRACLDKPGLPAASAKETALWAWTHRAEADQLGEAEWVAQAKAAYRREWNLARDNGTDLHEVASRLLAGKPVELVSPRTGEPYPDRVHELAEQVARFMDAWDLDPANALVEAPVFNERLRYAGRFDLHATVRGGERWLLDYKTGKTGIWPETCYQLAGYRNATHVVVDGRDLPMPEVDRVVGLWVRTDGWQAHTLRADESVWRAFRAMTALYNVASLHPAQMVGGAMSVPEVA